MKWHIGHIIQPQDVPS